MFQEMSARFADARCVLKVNPQGLIGLFPKAELPFSSARDCWAYDLGRHTHAKAKASFAMYRYRPGLYWPLCSGKDGDCARGVNREEDG